MSKCDNIIKLLGRDTRLTEDFQHDILCTNLRWAVTYSNFLRELRKNGDKAQLVLENTFKLCNKEIRMLISDWEKYKESESARYAVRTFNLILKKVSKKPE